MVHFTAEHKRWFLEHYEENHKAPEDATYLVKQQFYRDVWTRFNRAFPHSGLGNDINDTMDTSMNPFRCFIHGRVRQRFELVYYSIMYLLASRECYATRNVVWTEVVIHTAVENNVTQFRAPLCMGRRVPPGAGFPRLALMATRLVLDSDEYFSGALR